MKLQRGWLAPALPGEPVGGTTTSASSATSPSYTINPAIARHRARGGQHRGRQVGRPGGVKPAFFGVKPALILKGGFIAAAAMGDRMRPSRRRSRCTTGRCSAPWRRAARGLHHLHQPGRAGGGDARVARPGEARSAVKGCRGVRKRTCCTTADAPMEIDAQTYEVRAPTVNCSPASRRSVLPMAQRYFLF